MATHEVTRPLALNVTALEIAQALQDIIVTLPVVDNLTTNDGSKALSAKMGKKLNDEKFPIANIASALGQDVDKVPSNKVVDDAINAIITTLLTPTTVDITNQVSVYSNDFADVSLTVSKVGRICTLVLDAKQLYGPTTSGHAVLEGIPSAYSPIVSMISAVASYSSDVVLGRISVKKNGSIVMNESNFPANKAFTFSITYITAN